MLFPSEEFMFVFLPVVLALYYLIFRRFLTAKNVFLLVSSLLFYAWGEPVYVFLMMGMILMNWIYGLWVYGVRDSVVRARVVLALMVCSNLAVIGYFKYSGFLMENVNALLHRDWKVPAVALPIGISFYTFQAISYVVDVYRGKGEVQKNPLYVGLYIAFFPQLIAGPIVRYETVAYQMWHRRENWDDFAAGACRFFLILRVILIWQSVWAKCLDFILKKTSDIPT